MALAGLCVIRGLARQCPGQCPGMGETIRSEDSTLTDEQIRELFSPVAIGLSQRLDVTIEHASELLDRVLAIPPTEDEAAKLLDILREGVSSGG